MDCGTVAMTTVLSMYCTSFIWWEGVGILFTYRLKSTGETVHPVPLQPACHDVDVADWKNVWNVRQSRYEDMVFTSKMGRLGWLAFKGDL
jgi:hypothetical protein